jgi:hypothetical protein
MSDIPLFCFLFGIGPYSLTSVSFRMTAHTDLSSVFFLHLLLPIGFISFSVKSNHLNFGLPAFLLPSGFSRNTFYGPIIRHSYHMTSPFWSSYIYCCYNIWFSVHNLKFIIGSDSPASLFFYWAIYLSGQSQRPCGLRCGSTAARLPGIVGSNLAGGIDVCLL